MNMEIKNENFYVVQGWMLNELKLKGNELLVYAIIYGFCQNTNVCYASINYIQNFTGASKPTVIKAIQNLEEKGLIRKVGISEKGTNIYLCNELENFTSKETLPPLVKKLYSPSKETLPNNIIYNNNNIINVSNAKNEKQKHKHGEFQNVLLTENEYNKLSQELGSNKANAVIQYFSEMKEMKGYKYKSDYLAIKKWGIEAYNKKAPTVQNSASEPVKDYNSNPCPQCKQLRLYEKGNYFICDNCGKSLEYEKALEYFRFLHKK
ncbi:MAG: helix-turn-helix domain-containing protein [Treponema sp.]|nr:helix-turn-helix domain-containing protein [Treponema sp.]